MSTVVRPNYGTKGTDNITDLAELEGLLSPFQVEKLTYFFNQFFDFNEDGKIDAADFAGLNERLRKVAGWGEEDQEYINMVDNNRVFFECLLEQVLAERNKEGLEERSWAEALAPSKVVVDSVSLSSWLHMWARMCKVVIRSFSLLFHIFCRAALVLMTSPSGFNLSPGLYSSRHC